MNGKTHGKLSAMFLLALVISGRDLTASADPEIYQQPQSEVVFAGNSTSFTVGVTTTNILFYQWLKNGTNLTNGGEISGSAASSLNINPIYTNDAGNYSVIVTNEFGAATSSVATLTVETHSQLLNGLAAYYQFNNNALDSSSNHLDLTLFGSPGFAPGLFGQALDLHHDLNQYAQRLVDDAEFDFGSSAFTIQIWINLYSFGSFEQTFIEKFDNGSGPGWTLTSPTSHFQFYADGWGQLNGMTNVSTNVWHQLVVRRTGNQIDLLFDDDVLDSASVPSDIIPTPNGLLIGKRNPDDGRDFSVNGRLDEAAIWNRALSDSEIAALYNNGYGNPLLPISPLISAQSTNDSVLLGWQAVVGQSYQPQYATNLLQTNWTNLGAPITATTTTIVFSNSVANAQMFYRLMLPFQ